MMMQMLEKGGMEIVIDHVRIADEDNLMGYYEFEKVKKIKEDTTWLKNTRGRAFKMISMLLFDLPPIERYKVIFMQRNMKEVLASQKIMLGRLNNKSDIDDDEMERLFLVHLYKTYTWIENQANMEVLYVNYNDFISSPQKGAETVSRFLGIQLNTEKMAGAVDPILYRNRCDI
jgi:hypothetical protein